MTPLEKEIAAALNRHSAENISNTPDWILAQFLVGCLRAWNAGTQQREHWYGRDPSPSGPQPTETAAPLAGFHRAHCNTYRNESCSCDYWQQNDE